MKNWLYPDLEKKIFNPKGQVPDVLAKKKKKKKKRTCALCTSSLDSHTDVCA
jgi:hypothetical protein